jgi:hypothetical protein
MRSQFFRQFALSAIFTVGFAALVAGCATRRADTRGFIGTATIDTSGTICLHLRSVDAAGRIAEALPCYKQSDPKYASVKEHVGSIQVGEEKPIAPFN